MVVRAADGFGFRRGGAAVGGLAADDLKLDGGVGDVEAVAQGRVDGIEDGSGAGDGHFGDGDMAGEGVRCRAERPDMQVVDVEDAGDGVDGGANVGERECARRAFEQDVERLANDGCGRPLC